MPLARSTGPLISAVEGVFFPMVAAPSTRRLRITCVVTRTVLYKLAGRTLSVLEFLEVFRSPETRSSAWRATYTIARKRNRLWS